MDTKLYLDELVKTYETKDFIKDDPIQFPHRFKEKKDIEIAAFLSSIFAYGKREVFVSKLNILFERMQNEPFNFLLDFNEKEGLFDDFDYRFSRGIDLVQVLLILKSLYAQNESLESLYKYGWEGSKTIKGMLQTAVDYFYSRVTMDVTNGFFHLLPNPSKGSACKRLNMLLRWLVRDGEVDLGIWDFLPKSELLIPLDVHVAKVSRSLGLLKRKQNDYASVVELMAFLKSYDKEDPAKYDFAMFGYGVNSR